MPTYTLEVSEHDESTEVFSEQHTFSAAEEAVQHFFDLKMQNPFCCIALLVTYGTGLSVLFSAEDKALAVLNHSAELEKKNQGVYMFIFYVDYTSGSKFEYSVQDTSQLLEQWNKIKVKHDDSPLLELYTLSSYSVIGSDESNSVYLEGTESIDKFIQRL